MLSLSLTWISTQREKTLRMPLKRPGTPLVFGALRKRTQGGRFRQASGTMPHPEEQEIVTLVDIDFAAYRRANDLRTVRKNVTLPSWLNDLAERNGVNFSQVLQESLKERLHVSNPCKQPVKE